MTSLFFLHLVVYLLLIAPFRFFMGSLSTVWLAEAKGRYPTYRKLVLIQMDYAWLLAAAWPITMWPAYVHGVVTFFLIFRGQLKR